jgi:DNA-binding NtrC family response regulator
MSPYAQAKILRAIETKEFQRVGGRSTSVDIRVIAATNQDLEQRVAAGQFREDLFFRINVARLHLPPLRDRKEDLPILTKHYLRDLNRRFGREVEGFTEAAWGYLIRYSWPGNVRELRNLLEAVFINLPNFPITRISLDELPAPFLRRLRDAENLPADERERMLSALFATNWNKSKAAQRLRWSRMTLYRKMAKYRIVTRTQV